MKPPLQGASSAFVYKKNNLRIETIFISVGEQGGKSLFFFFFGKRVFVCLGSCFTFFLVRARINSALRALWRALAARSLTRTNGGSKHTQVFFKSYPRAHSTDFDFLFSSSSFSLVIISAPPPVGSLQGIVDVMVLVNFSLERAQCPARGGRGPRGAGQTKILCRVV